MCENQCVNCVSLCNERRHWFAWYFFFDKELCESKEKRKEKKKSDVKKIKFPPPSSQPTKVSSEISKNGRIDDGVAADGRRVKFEKKKMRKKVSGKKTFFFKVSFTISEGKAKLLLLLLY